MQHSRMECLGSSNLNTLLCLFAHIFTATSEMGSCSCRPDIADLLPTPPGPLQLKTSWGEVIPSLEAKSVCAISDLQWSIAHTPFCRWQHITQRKVHCELCGRRLRERLIIWIQCYYCYYGGICCLYVASLFALFRYYVHY